VRAAVCRAFGAPLEIEDLRLDAPESGEVRVRIAACAICHSDIAFIEGAWGGALPAVYGHEAAGVVEDVGAGVRSIEAGDRVVVSLLRSCGRCYFCERGESHLCELELPSDRKGRLRTGAGETVHPAMHTGAFAEEVVVHESQVAPVPSSIPFDVSSLLGCGVVTGLGAALDRAAVARGSSVVVVGTGGVGLNVVQGAALAGAERILGVDISPAKREAALLFGATDTVDPAASNDPVAAVRGLTGGRGADYVFVTVGRSDVIERSMSHVRRGGTLVVVGMPPSGETFEVAAVDLVHDDIRILGSKLGSARLAHMVPRVLDLYERGQVKLDELISARYPFEQINDALAAARDGDALRNVVVFGE
jgi:S-(hydroxymethyl)glutathione dehydrogenase / alcohol dehydrogenase